MISDGSIEQPRMLFYNIPIQGSMRKYQNIVIIYLNLHSVYILELVRSLSTRVRRETWRVGRVCVPINPALIDEFDPEGVPTVSDLLNELDHLPAAGEVDEKARRVEGGSSPYRDSREANGRLWTHFTKTICWDVWEACCCCPQRLEDGQEG